MARKARDKATAKNLPVGKVRARTVKGGGKPKAQPAAAAASRPPSAPIASFIPGLNPVVTG